jgi:hypothetical protein
VLNDTRSIKRDKAEALLEAGDINLKVADTYSKETPGHLCCKNGHVDILRKILTKSPEAGACLDDQGNTLLHSLANVSYKLINWW